MRNAGLGWGIFLAMLGIVGGASSGARAQDDGEDTSDDTGDDGSGGGGGGVDADGDGSPDRYWAFRIGGDLGFARLEETSYYQVNLVGMVRAGPIRADLWAPLLFATEGFDFNDGNWDTGRDFNRIARCVRIDLGDFTTPQDIPDTAATCDPWGWSTPGIHNRVYFNARLSPIESHTLGHGTLVDEFRNSADLDRPQLGIRSDSILLDWGYTQFLLDDVADPHVIGGRLAWRPQQVLFGMNWDETPDDGEIGFTAVSDLQAPLHLQTAFGRPLQDQDGYLRYTSQSMTAVGVDAHYTYYWGLDVAEDPLSGLQFLVDYNRFLEVEDADGLHVGVRFVYKDIYSSEASQFQFRGGAEFRYIGNRYLPTYFDSDYIIRSQRFGLNSDSLAVVGGNERTTMLEYVLGLPGGHTFGFQGYLEFMIPIPTGQNMAPTILPLSLFVEGADQEASWSAGITAGPFEMDQAIVMAQYLRRNFDSIAGVVDPDGALIRLMARVYLANPHESGENETFLNNVHIDARYDHRFFLNTVQGNFEKTDDFSITLGFTTGTD